MRRDFRGVWVSKLRRGEPKSKTGTLRQRHTAAPRLAPQCLTLFEYKTCR